MRTLQKNLANFAIYNNFTTEHLKTNKAKVTTHCKDRDCPWHIHASIIVNGPRFKVQIYNSANHCSKPTIGMSHRHASSELIANYILDKVRINNDLKPKEIMNDYQMEFGNIISHRKTHIAKETSLP